MLESLLLESNIQLFDKINGFLNPNNDRNDQFLYSNKQRVFTIIQLFMRVEYLPMTKDLLQLLLSVSNIQLFVQLFDKIKDFLNPNETD